MPYIKRRLDESYDIHAAHAGILGPQFQERDRLNADSTVRQRIFYYYKWFLRKVYPSVNAAFYLSLLAFNLSYLFDGSKYHSPFLWLIGTRMRRMNSADFKAIAHATELPAPRQGAARPGQTNSIFSSRTLTHTVYPRLLSSLKILLPTSIFALKFLEWWHASDFARQLSRKAAEGLELPPPTISNIPAPPTKTSEKKSGVTFSDDAKGPQSPSAEAKPSPFANRKPPISTQTGLPILIVPPAYSSELCPICLAPVQTPTASPSGYVFCYTCIFRWVDGMHSRQEAFMKGEESGPEEDAWIRGEEHVADDKAAEGVKGSREGRWESGKGRCAVTGKRVLGGTGGLRRVMV